MSQLNEDVLMSTYTYMVEILPQYCTESNSDLANFFVDALRRDIPLEQLKPVFTQDVTELDVINNVTEFVDKVFKYIGTQLYPTDTNDTIDLYNDHTMHTDDVDTVEHTDIPALEHDDNNNNESKSAETTPKHKIRASDGTSIFVSNIPTELHNIQQLNTYFQQFGTNNVQLVAKDKAIIEFDTFEHATAALQSPAAVLNNRFITLAKYTVPNKNKHNKQKLPFSKPQYNKPVGYKPYHQSKYKPHYKRAPSTQQHNTEHITAEQRAAEIASKRANGQTVTEPLKSIDKPLTAKRAGVDNDNDKQAALNALRQKLIAKQIQKQKDLLAKLQSNPLNPEDKRSVMSELKELNESIKQSMNKHANATVTQNNVKRTKM